MKKQLLLKTVVASLLAASLGAPLGSVVAQEAAQVPAVQQSTIIYPAPLAEGARVRYDAERGIAVVGKGATAEDFDKTFTDPTQMTAVWFDGADAPAVTNASEWLADKRVKVGSVGFEKTSLPGDFDGKTFRGFTADKPMFIFDSGGSGNFQWLIYAGFTDSRYVMADSDADMGHFLTDYLPECRNCKVDFDTARIGPEKLVAAVNAQPDGSIKLKAVGFIVPVEADDTIDELKGMNVKKFDVDRFGFRTVTGAPFKLTTPEAGKAYGWLMPGWGTDTVLVGGSNVDMTKAAGETYVDTLADSHGPLVCGTFVSADWGTADKLAGIGAKAKEFSTHLVIQEGGNRANFELLMENAHGFAIAMPDTAQGASSTLERLNDKTAAAAVFKPGVTPALDKTKYPNFMESKGHTIVANSEHESELATATLIPQTEEYAVSGAAPPHGQ